MDYYSCARRAAPLLFLSAGEASEQQTVVAGGVVRPLVVEASGGGIPTSIECPARAKAGQASGGGTLEVGSSITEIAGRLLFLSACEESEGGWLWLREARCAAAGRSGQRW